MPPAMLVTALKPALSRMSRPCADRLPVRHTTTMSRSAGTSPVREASEPSEISVASGMWPVTHSSSSRTSRMKAPASRIAAAFATSTSIGSVEAGTVGPTDTRSVGSGAVVAALEPQAATTTASSAAASRASRGDRSVIGALRSGGADDRPCRGDVPRAVRPDAARRTAYPVRLIGPRAW